MKESVCVTRKCELQTLTVLLLLQKSVFAAEEKDESQIKNLMKDLD